MAVGSIIIDISSLTTHGTTLFASGTKVLKCLYYAVDYNSTGTKLGLIDNPYASQCYLSPGNGFTGSLVGNTGTTGGSTAGMVPVFIDANVGLRVFTGVSAGSLIVVAYVEMTS